MKGISLGEIIGSPYTKENIKDINNFFFPLFEDQIIPILKKSGLGYYEKVFRATAGSLTEAVCSVDFDSSEPVAIMTERQALCVSIVYGDLLARSNKIDYEQAVSRANTFFLEQTNKDVLIKGVLTAFTLRKNGLISAYQEAGLDRDTSLSDYSLLLRGHHINTLPHDGSEVLMASLACLVNSRSWEESIRRSVALGGDSAYMGAITGALAEILYGEIPGHIQSRLDEFIDSSQSKILSVLSNTSSLEARVIHPVKTEKFTVIPVLSLPGKSPIYAVPDGREDIVNCINSVNPNAIITSKPKLEDLRKKLNERYDKDGQPLHGTCLDSPRADYHVVYYDHREHKLYSVFTYTGNKELRELEKRINNRTEWLDFLRKVETIRFTQEHLVGHDPADGHIRFDSAYYIETTSSQVRLMRGSLVCGEFGVTNKGELRVNPNAQDASYVGEYLEAAINNRKVFPLNANSKQILALLAEYCLDDGLNASDQSRTLMSNYDRMMSDLNAQGSDIPRAILPSDCHIKDKLSAPVRRYDYGCSSEVKTISRSVNKKAYPNSLFTIGCAGITIERFINLLKNYGISVVRDARSIPFSKLFPQFNKDELAKSLAIAGIDYRYNGDTIGDKPTNKLPESQGDISFIQITGTPIEVVKKNAQEADLTLLFAKDFTTPEERCTINNANLTFEIPLGEFLSQDVALSVIDNLSDSQKKKGITINISGNNIHTLSKYNITQEQINEYISSVMFQLKDRVVIRQVISGGQSGAEQAGVTASINNRLPVVIYASRYWTLKGIEQKDIHNEYMFKSRFINLPKQNMLYSKQVEDISFRNTLSSIINEVESGIRTAVLTSDAKAEYSFRFACLGVCMTHPDIIGLSNDSTDVRHISQDGTISSQAILEKKYFPRHYEENLLHSIDGYQEKLEENRQKYIKRKSVIKR